MESQGDIIQKRIIIKHKNNYRTELLKIIQNRLEKCSKNLKNQEEKLRDDLGLLTKLNEKKLQTEAAIFIFVYRKKLLLIDQLKIKIKNLQSREGDLSIRIKDNSSKQFTQRELESIIWGINYLSNKNKELVEVLVIFKSWIEYHLGPNESKTFWLYYNIDPIVIEINSMEPSNEAINNIIKTALEEQQQKQQVTNDKKKLININEIPENEEIKKPSAPLNIPSSTNARNNVKKQQEEEHNLMHMSMARPSKPKVLLDQNLKISCIKNVNKTGIQIYESLLSEYEKQNKLYVDNEFPTNDVSLTYNMNIFPKAKGLIWRRASDIYSSKNLSLFGNLGPNNIIQGSLGDCYFLSAVSVLSENAEILKRIFHSKQITKCGAYSIWLCDSGEWKNVIIDDYIPCNPSTGHPAFSKSTGEGIWVLLLEKAYAKLFRSYQGIESGIAADAFRALTGATTEYFDDEDATQIDERFGAKWSFIVTNLENKFLLTASTKGVQVNDVNQSFYGLVSDHCYAILQACEVDTGNGKKEKLVKIRNPWGSGEWKGNWSDGSSKWTQALKQQLKYNPELNDGIFWINLQDFDLHFDSLCVCKIHQQYQYKFIRLQQTERENVSVVNLAVSNKTYAYLSIIQKEKRHFKGIDDYEYSKIRLLICKIDTQFNFEKFIHGESHKSNHHNFDGLLDPGLYLIYIDADWMQTNYTDLILSVYSEKEVEMVDITGNKDTNNVFLKKIIRLHALSNTKLVKVTDYKSEGIDEIKRYACNLASFYYVYYINQSFNAILFDHVEISSDGYYFDDGLNRDNKDIIKMIEPGKEELLLLRQSKYSVGTKTTFYNKSRIVQLYSDEDLISNAKKDPNKKSYKQHGLNAYKFVYNGGEAHYFENTGKKICNVEVTFTVLQNYEANGTNQLNHKFVLISNQGGLLNLKIKDPFSGSQHKMTYLISSE